MIRKICVLFLVTILARAGNCFEEEEQGYFGKLTDIPFNIIDLPLAAANDAIYKSFNFASNFVEKVSGSVRSATRRMYDFAYSIAEGTIESFRSVVKSLRDAKDGITQTISGINHDLSGVRDEYLNKLKGVREGVLKGALKQAHDFLKNASEAAHSQMENALHAGQEALEKASELAKDFIKEAKEKGEAKKVEVLEKANAEIEKFKEQYKDLKENFSEKLRKLADNIKDNIGTENYEEYKKKLEDFFNKFKSILNEGSELGTKAKSKIDDLLKAGKDALENWSEEHKPKIQYIKEKLHELRTKAAAYRDDVVADAKEKISHIAQRSKSVIDSFFESLGKVFKNSVSNLKKIFNATAALVGDFLNRKPSHSNQPTPPPLEEEEEPLEPKPVPETVPQPTEDFDNKQTQPEPPQLEPPQPHPSEESDADEPIIDDPLIYDIDVRMKAANDVGDDLTDIADNFDEAIRFPVSEEEVDDSVPSTNEPPTTIADSDFNLDDIPNPDFGADSVDKTENALNQLLNKIKEITENGKDTINDLFEKGRELYENSKGKINASISDHIQFITEKIQQMKEFIQQLIKKIGNKVREAKRRFADWISKATEKVKQGINNKVEKMSTEVRQSTPDTKDLYYKVQGKLEELKRAAQEKVEDFMAQANVKISDAIEKAKATAEEVKHFIETKFLGGAKRSVQCLKEHKDQISEHLSKVTREISNCGTEGAKELTKAVSKALDLEGGLSEKLEKLKDEFKHCKQNSGLFGAVTCLGKLSYNETLGFAKASGNIFKAAKVAAENVATCTKNKVEGNRDSFAKLKDDISHCLAQNQE